MKLNIAVCALSLGIMCAMTSCLGDADSSYTYSDDTSIVAVSFGTLSRTIHVTKSDGTDSTYTSTYSGSYYPLHVDQLNRRIYNIDSLLVGTNMDKMFLSVSTKNSAAAYITYNDTMYSYINSTDTLDLSQPRKISVISNDGRNRCDYILTAVAHQEYADSFTWSKSVTDENMKLMSSLRAVSLGGSVFYLGNKQTSASNYDIATASDLYEAKIDGTYSPTLLRSFPEGSQITTDGSKLYVFAPSYSATSGGTTTVESAQLLQSSDNGATWEAIASADLSNITAIAAVYNGEIIAVNNAGALVQSSDEGATWTVASTDGMTSFVPTTDVNAVIQQLTTNEGMSRLYLIGNVSDATSTTTTVWSRLYDFNSGIYESWIYQPWDTNNGYTLPRLRATSAVSYGDYLLAIGDSVLATPSETANYTQIYSSYDHGITWKDKDSFRLPKGFAVSSSSNAAIVVDKNNIVWILCGGTGQVWRGRLHKMTWADTQKTFR